MPTWRSLIGLQGNHMADKTENKAEAPAQDKKPAAAPGKTPLLSRIPVLLGGVMLIEAVVLFAGFKFLGGGAVPVAGAELILPADTHGGHGDASSVVLDRTQVVELMVLEFRAPNKLSGRTFLYDVSVYVVTTAEHEEEVRNTLKRREALIKDRIRTIVAQSDPDKLGGGSEPGLETLRRQIRYQLDEIIGEGLIQEVLIPRCIPFRVEF